MKGRCVTMMNDIRYKIGAHFLKKAHEQFQNNDFKNGFKNLKLGVMIVPSSKELSSFGAKMRVMADEQLKKIES